MASTNKTSNYELSQFLGTDKPTFLSDYNGDMLKIDTAIKGVDTKAESAQSTANTAVASAQGAVDAAGQAQTDATAAVTTANTASSVANTAADTANNAQSTAVLAKNTADSAATAAATADSKAVAASAKATSAFKMETDTVEVTAASDTYGTALNKLSTALGTYVTNLPTGSLAKIIKIQFGNSSEDISTSDIMPKTTSSAVVRDLISYSASGAASSLNMNVTHIHPSQSSKYGVSLRSTGNTITDSTATAMTDGDKITVTILRLSPNT